MSRSLLFAVWISVCAIIAPLLGDETQIIFHDDFNRADADAVGNDWSSRGTAMLKDQALFFQLNEEEFRPRTQRTFPIQKQGKLTVSFVMDWLRESEGTWSFYIQLGNSQEFPRLLVEPEDLSKGVGVNLLWGGREPVNFKASGSFGYCRGRKFEPLFVLNDNEHKESVVEKPVITIVIDIDAGTYTVKFNDKTYPDLPFDSKVPIDTIRFISNGCSKAGFSKSSIDDVKIIRVR